MNVEVLRMRFYEERRMANFLQHVQILIKKQIRILAILKGTVDITPSDPTYIARNL